MNKLKELSEQFRCEFLPQFRQVIGFSFVACLVGWLLFLPEKVWGAGQGGAPGGFLQFGAGARALAMGRAFVGVADDASAVTWNPAGLVQVDRKEIQAMTATLFAETKFQYLSFVWPRKKGSVWGFNLSQLQSTGFEKVEVTIDPASSPDSPNFLKVEKVGDFIVGQQAITMAYGRPITEKVSVGLNFKQATNQVDDFTQKFMTFDVGMLANGLWKNHRMGMVIQNAVTQVTGETEDKLPLIFRIGNSYSILNGRVLASLDIQQSQFSGMGWNMGMELWAVRSFALRLGLEFRGEVSEADFGFGFKWKGISLDMAMGFSELGQSQRMGLSWRFGKSNRKRIKADIKKIIDQGFESFRQGDYVKALKKLELAAASDPSDRKVGSMVEKLRSIVASIPQIKGIPAEIARLISRGIQSYVDGDLSTAYDALRSAFEKNPSDGRLMALTNRVAQASGKPLVEPPSPVIPPSARWTHEDQKLNDALRAIYEGRYDLAIQRCEEVLKINPNNAVALGRMGAAFFLMGEKDKAILLWRRALEIDPNHKPAIEYLKQLGELREEEQ